ncbi:MAG: protease HtpX [Myxococcales bacterium]|nr:MAG: protease HtpX [Myxococcales bacterium]
MFKRITLLVLTNFAIVAALGLIFSLLSALGVFDLANGLGGYGPLLVMAALFGFGGSFLSLLASKWIAKWTTRAKVIDAPRNDAERWLLDTVARHANRVGIKMPEVAIYDSPDMNAFATGATRNSSLVAVSTGLLQQMDRSEVDAVLGHEIAHVANGDMVTLTLLQGVLNTFVIFFSEIIGRVVDAALRGRDDERSGPGIGYWITTMVARMVLGIFAMLIVNAFSRYREFRADEGGASLAGRDKMISALRRLSRSDESHLPEAVAAFGITPRGSNWGALFSSHPPIAERIARLQAAPAH